MAGYGTGYPLWFECPKARRYYRSDPAEQARLRDNHSVTLTGKTKPVPFDGKSHPRRSQLPSVLLDETIQSSVPL